ncbi:MAG: hypothetical protein GY753_12060 [Gammaproteobacteria bacterium]|nr:hypothetical protein [Gammaproteobacteria bacterium]
MKLWSASSAAAAQQQVSLLQLFELQASFELAFWQSGVIFDMSAICRVSEV